MAVVATFPHWSMPPCQQGVSMFVLLCTSTTSKLERGADINRQWADGNTPLMDAALMGDTEAVALLLCRGAVVDLPNKKHQTALHAACFQAHEGAVRLLLAAGASTTLEDS